jgi:hypothetical protein
VDFSKKTNATYQAIWEDERNQFSIAVIGGIASISALAIICGKIGRRMSMGTVEGFEVIYEVSPHHNLHTCNEINKLIFQQLGREQMLRGMSPNDRVNSMRDCARTPPKDPETPRSSSNYNSII